jgi:hypothetical protein
MGVLDRVIRLLIAAAVAILFFTDVITGPWAIVLLLSDLYDLRRKYLLEERQGLT